MRILGIVAEYDPFHNGHLRHMTLARQQAAPDFTLVALSPCFRQRGEMALLSPLDRARCALEAGADAVLALPVEWTLRDAEHYALGAVALLGRLGATHLAFGAETPDLSLLSRTAALLEAPPDALTAALKKGLAGGLGYPAALSRAVDAVQGTENNPLHAPNNILAVCYLRAVRRLGLSLEPVVIPRQENDRNSGLNPDAPSATALREALRRGNYAALRALPPVSEGLLRRRLLDGQTPRPDVYDALLLSRLRAMSPEDFSRLPDAAEGLDRALQNAAREARSADELLRALTGKRYPASRVRRLCACALLGMTRQAVESLPLPEDALLLGLRRAPALTASWRQGPVAVRSSFAAWQKSARPADVTAWRLWAQVCGLKDTLPMSERLVTV